MKINTLLILLDQEQVENGSLHSLSTIAQLKQPLTSLNFIVRKNDRIIRESGDILEDYDDYIQLVLKERIYQVCNQRFGNVHNVDIEFINNSVSSPFSFLDTNTHFDAMVIWESTDTLYQRLLQRTSKPIFILPNQQKNSSETVFFPVNKNNLNENSLEILNLLEQSNLSLNITHYYKDAEWHLMQTIYTPDEVEALLNKKASIEEKLQKVVAHRKEQINRLALQLKNTESIIDCQPWKVSEEIEKQIGDKVIKVDPSLVILDSETIHLKSYSAKSIRRIVNGYPVMLVNRNNPKIYDSIFRRVMDSFQMSHH